MSTDRRRLVHCDSAFLVEPIQLCLAADYTAVTVTEVSRSEWLNVYKSRSPNGGSPYLEIGESVLADPVAIFTFLADLGSRIPKDVQTRAEVCTVIDTCYDFLIRADQARQRDELRSFFETELPLTLQKAEEFLPPAQASTGDFDDDDVDDEALEAANLLVTYLVAKAQMINAQVALPSFPRIKKVHSQCMKAREVKSFFANLKVDSAVPEVVGLSTPSEANPIRWALAIGNVGFCYRYVAKENSDALKATGTDVKIPMIRVDDKSLTGRTGMLGYAAQRAGLVPKHPVKTALAWSYVGNLNQLLDMLDEKKGSKSTLKKELPEMVARIERMIGTEQDAEGHLIDFRLSFADLWCAMVYEKLCCTGPDSLGKVLKSIQTLTPNMRKCYDMVKNIEVVKIFDYRLPQRLPVLTYFDIPARAEPIRLIFKIGNIPFEDRRLTRDDWIDRHKSFSPTGQCPILDVNGKTFVETRAILGYAAERAGLVSPTPLGRMTADMLHSAFGRALTEQAKIHTVPKGVERDNMRSNIRENLLPPIMGMMEALCARDQHPAGYLVDNQLSWVDVYIASELQFMHTYRYLSDQSREAFPCLFKVHDLVFSLPAVKDYQAQKHSTTSGGYSP